MSVAAPVTLEHFFQNPTKPASEYRDGELIQKSLASNLHSELQSWISHLLLLEMGAPWNRVKSEQDVRLNEQTILVPDVCVVQPGSPEAGQAITEPPVLCIEILSPSDRLTATVKKCQEYLRWGVPFCWILNPESKEAWIVKPTGIEPVLADEFLTAGQLSIPVAKVFLAG